MTLTKLTKPRARWATFKLKNVVSAVVRSIYDKLSESPSIRDFGAVCDGVADDTDAAINMLRETGTIIFEGNRITRTIDIGDNNVIIRSKFGMLGDAGMIIDHDEEDIFAHKGSAWGAEGLTIRDLHVSKRYSGAPNENQHFYTPYSPNGWKKFENIQIQDIGGGFHRVIAATGGDVYTQRLQINNIRAWRCGTMFATTGDDTTVQRRPVCTIANVDNLDFKDGRNTSYSKYTYDLRGWRQVHSDSVWETGYGSSATVNNLVALVGVRTNCPLYLNTIWYEAGAPWTVPHVFDFPTTMTSQVDGTCGAYVELKCIDTTRSSPMCKFAEGVKYDVHVGTVGNIYTWYTYPKDLMKYSNSYTLRSTLTIDKLYWRLEDSRPLPFPLPKYTKGFLKVKEMTFNKLPTDVPYLPPVSSPDSELIYEWHAGEKAGETDFTNANTRYFKVEVADGASAMAKHKDSFAMNVSKTGGVPRLLYTLDPSSYGGSWFTILVDYYCVSPAGDIKPSIIGTVANSDARDTVIGAVNPNGSDYSTAYAFVQPKRVLQLESMKTGSDTPTGETRFLIRSIKVYAGLNTDMSSLNK